MLGFRKSKSKSSGLFEPTRTNGAPVASINRAAVDRQLEDFASTDDARVVAFLQNHKRFRALVDRTGHSYVVPEPEQQRVETELKRLLEDVFGAAIIKHISPSEFSVVYGELGTQDKNEAGHNRNFSWVVDAAIKQKASDVYVNIGDPKARIYFRTHGVISFFNELSKNDAYAMVRSLWVQAHKTAHFLENETCDCSLDWLGYRLRGNSLPDTRGNSVVLRLRDPEFTLPINELGYDERQTQCIDDMCNAPGGLGVICGETGSGKSTTLSSIMALLDESQKVIEVADPIEIEYPHVTHVPIQHYVGDEQERFQKILSALVRQNPDVLFIGEIRDSLSASAAQNMAVQGKVVWTTLHTQTCATAIPRMEQLGVDFNLLALPSFLTGVVNQNLVPIVCSGCGLDRHPDDEVDRGYRNRFGSTVRFRNAEGCDACIAGVSAQTVVAEVFPLCRDTNGAAHRFVADRDMMGLESYMRQTHGMQSKQQHAESKIRTGLIDPMLTERVVGRIVTS